MTDSDPFPLSQAGDANGPAQQRAKRDSLFLMINLALETGEKLGQARVRNLSATGLMADCEHHFKAGDRVVFPLRGVGEMAGTIAWADGKRIGVAFDLQIDPQLARKPLQDDPAGNMPPYLRHLNRSMRFTR